MGDDAAPTELAGIAEAGTEAVQAWALDFDDDPPTRRFTPRRITAAALAGCLVLIAAAGVVALFVIRGAWHSEPTAAPVVVAAAPEPAPAATPTTMVQPRPAAPPGSWITPTKAVTVTVQAPPDTVQAIADSG